MSDGYHHHDADGGQNHRQAGPAGEGSGPGEIDRKKQQGNRQSHSRRLDEVQGCGGGLSHQAGIGQDDADDVTDDDRIQPLQQAKRRFFTKDDEKQGENEGDNNQRPARHVYHSPRSTRMFRSPL